MARGILFDLDGTITDSSLPMARAVASAMGNRGIQPPNEAALVQSVRRDSPMAILRRAGVPLSGYWKEYVLYCGTCTSIPGFRVAIEHAEMQGVRCGIVTSLPQAAAQSLLRAIGLSGRFSCIVTYGSTRLHKPHGDPVVAGVVDLQLRPEDCVYVGDQPSDVIAGKAAGVGTVAVLWGFGDEEALRAAAPDTILSDPSKLISFIEQF
jgi:pyrophosphatase PpaX